MIFYLSIRLFIIKCNAIDRFSLSLFILPVYTLCPIRLNNCSEAPLGACSIDSVLIEGLGYTFKLLKADMVLTPNPMSTSLQYVSFPQAEYAVAQASNNP